MKKHLKRVLFYKDKHGIKYTVPVVFISILLVCVIVALFVNTAGMHHSLQKSTKNYADDVSAQLASNISSRMQMRRIYIQNLADTFAGMPEFLITKELLDQKAEYLGMKEIFVLRKDMSTIPGNIDHPELGEYLKTHPDMYNTPHIFYTDHDEVFFSAPIVWKNSGETALLLGVRTDALLQQMLRDVDFKEQGLCCIVDSDGTVIVSEIDTIPFRQLNDIFDKNAYGEDAEEAQRVLKDVNEHRSGTAKFRNIGGEPLMLGYDFLGINDWMLLTILPSNLFTKETGIYMVYYVIIIGITALIMLLIFIYIVYSHRRSLKKIQDIALTDSLTGGKNNLAFRMEGEYMLQKNSQHNYAIAYMNIRNFKRFNERFGVEIGDEILCQIHSVLSECLCEGESMARSTGDHFYLLLECADEDTVRRRMQTVLERLEDRLSEHFPIDRTRIALGAYLIQKTDTDFLIIEDKAKVASTYQMENEPCRFYDDELGKQMEREQSLDDSFKNALLNHEFKLYIQPKVSLAHDQIGGGEVLVRWQHPKYGLLFPGDFIPIFERSGKICDLDFYIFEETCKLLKSWIAEGCAVPLSVNLSRAHLISSDLSFLYRFKSIKKAYNIPDGLIELELTESFLLKQRELNLVAVMIERMRSMGFSCSMDDFGFGYSSLAQLKDLNVNTVKLDRQFFLDESAKSWLVVRKLIHLIHDLGITVVAEGIETKEQVGKLRQFGCDFIQGYVYAKPMTVSDFKKWSVPRS